MGDIKNLVMRLEILSDINNLLDDDRILTRELLEECVNIIKTSRGVGDDELWKAYIV